MQAWFHPTEGDVGNLPGSTESSPMYCGDDYKQHLAELRQKRHNAIQLGIARAYVLVDARAHQSTGWVELIWDEELGRHNDGVPPTFCQMRSAGAPQTAIKRLQEGNLGIEDLLGCWTGEFLLGLKLSGALTEKEHGQYRICTKLHPELTKDIKNWILAGWLGRPDRDGRQRLIGCKAVQYLPAKDPMGAEVVAGLLAGARLSWNEGEQWFEVPDTASNRQLLEHWTILHSPSRCMRSRQYLKVSPFYAPLFLDLMPEQSQQRVLGVRKPAMCPLLPLVYWEWSFAPSMKKYRILPFADALPYGISRRSFYRHGWKRRELHRKAIFEVGILSVHGGLRKRMYAWFEAHREAREKGAMVQNG